VRSFEGQRSDSRPVQRTREEKERMLKRLEQDLAQMPPRAMVSTRDALIARIREVKADLAAAKARPPRDRDREQRERSHEPRTPRRTTVTPPTPPTPSSD
jgi:hypothetical protein